MGDRNMKYVIKQKSEFVMDARYVQLEADTGPGFTYPIVIDRATQFDTIEEAVTAIIDRTNFMHSISFSSDGQFTIVGIKEVSAPRYEEVAL